MQSHPVKARKRVPSVEAAQVDFRQFIELLRHDHDLAEIDREIDPHLEAAAIVRRVAEVKGKAPLFNNIKGAEPGGLFRIFGNAASLRNSAKERYGRIARTFGLKPTASWKDISLRLEGGASAPAQPPRVLPTGPCKENILRGDMVDLHKIPAPKLHMDDGGKYLQTYGVHILQTPDGRWSNWSIFRGMVHDSKHLVCLVGNGQHVSIIRDEWLAQGHTKIPWALAFGVPPAANFVAGLPLPEGVSEAEFTGALVGQPLDMVKCEMSNLLVPASSEIVFEGTMSLTEKGDEGPFGDALAVVFEGNKQKHPLFRVDMITYRDNPILPISVPGRTCDESHTTSALASVEILALCRKMGLPVLSACVPLESYGTWCALQIDTDALSNLDTTAPAFRRMLGSRLFNNKACMLINRLILVGKDVDVYSFESVTWALATRCRPGVDEEIFEDVPSFPMTPYMSHGRGPKGKGGQGGKVISDCVLQMEYEHGSRAAFSTVGFQTSYPDELRKKVEEMWVDMGFDEV
ncbi:UbiD family decarboxylase [Lizonia empirigonia]|nr:UbiD family decarboxylase [Lizonia empirigonia]